MKTTRPVINVGIVTAPAITVNFHAPYIDSLTGKTIEGTIEITEVESERIFTPTDEATGMFEIERVIIGVSFHWERSETQSFCGSLKIIPGLTAINVIDAERYLESVISSEMSSNASTELLKAHSVISRSWLMAMLLRRNGKQLAVEADDRMDTTPDETVQWWDREDHTLFDVCADDHCQRYQGLKRLRRRAVEAVKATRGEVLTHNGVVCDARFSKCCGGVSERFESCWAPVSHSYLSPVRDYADATPLPDLTTEDGARQWIMSAPEAFCNTADDAILAQVLNTYDRETRHFYRWSVSYTRAELASLLKERTGIDFGDIKALTPLERGASGRIIRLRIEGTLRTMTIGKELAIRRALSPSHLYSSAFVVTTEGTDANGLPATFTLHGAGWGHGVGLCQIGAAMMAERGYSYRDILHHYYRGAVIDTIYE